MEVEVGESLGISLIFAGLETRGRTLCAMVISLTLTRAHQYISFNLHCNLVAKLLINLLGSTTSTRVVLSFKKLCKRVGKLRTLI